MDNDLTVSIIIPTCDRKVSLLRLLATLAESIYPIHEVIIVDSSVQPLTFEELVPFEKLKIKYLRSQRSVCIQRNIGISKASGRWIFLCDDDLEIPPEYLTELTNHITSNTRVGAVSGLVLQREDKKWGEQYPITSTARLLWNFIFQLSIWGEIKCGGKNLLISSIKRYYKTKGNHISKAGWPVLTDFEGEYFKTPIYGLGASLVKKEWLINSPYDEVLDANGIGDNYGVAVGFPKEGIHVLKKAFVYHHRETINRPKNSARYFKRILALDYFIKTKPELKSVSWRWFYWSLIGTAIENVVAGNINMKASLTSIITILRGKNPYFLGAKRNAKIIEPTL